MPSRGTQLIVSGKSPVRNASTALILAKQQLDVVFVVVLPQGGEGLGTMWGQEKARELLSAAGFRQIEIHQLAHDFQNDYYVIRK